MLELRGVSKEYYRCLRTKESAFNAVNNVNLSIEPGEFISIIGRSGSGKSTLLNMSAGLIKPTAGDILFNEENIHKYNDREISFYRNEKIGFVPQGQSLLSNFTVLENICLPWFLYEREGDPSSRALELLEKTGIGELAGSYPKELSGGEMRRAAIVRSLINKPALLIADEPTNDLDSQTTAEIMKLFYSIAQEGTAVLIVTHELDTLSYSTKTYSMDNGSLSLQQ
jgi:putative ABC transport system ATP-binding protein